MTIKYEKINFKCKLVFIYYYIFILITKLPTMNNVLNKSSKYLKNKIIL